MDEDSPWRGDEPIDPPAAIEALVWAARACASRYAPRPGDGSIAERQMARMSEAAFPGWFADEVSVAFTQARILLIEADDLMMGMARLMRAMLEEGQGWGVPVLGRSAIEASARAHWLTKRDLSIVERATRAQTMRLLGWWWCLRDEDPSSARSQDLNSRTQDIVDGALASGLSAGPATNNHAAWVGEEPPGFRKSVGLLFDPDPSPYALFSGYAHGGLHALLMGITSKAIPRSSTVMLTFGPTFDEVHSMAAAALMGYWKATQAAFEVLGWNDAEWRAIAKQTLSDFIAWPDGG